MLVTIVYHCRHVGALPLLAMTRRLGKAALQRLFFCFCGKYRRYFADPVLCFPGVPAYNSSTREVDPVTAKERILALRLLRL